MWHQDEAVRNLIEKPPGRIANDLAVVNGQPELVSGRSGVVHDQAAHVQPDDDLARATFG